MFMVQEHLNSSTFRVSSGCSSSGCHAALYTRYMLVGHACLNISRLRHTHEIGPASFQCITTDTLFGITQASLIPLHHRHHSSLLQSEHIQAGRRRIRLRGAAQCRDRVAVVRLHGIGASSAVTCIGPYRELSDYRTWISEVCMVVLKNWFYQLLIESTRDLIPWMFFWSKIFLLRRWNNYNCSTGSISRKTWCLFSPSFFHFFPTKLRVTISPDPRLSPSQ